MKRSSKIALAVVASSGLGLAVAASFAHPGGIGPRMMRGMGPVFGAAGHGPMGARMGGRMGGGPMGGQFSSPFGGPMGGPMAAPMQSDPAFAGDMHLVRDMIHSHERIKRTVTNLPDGIRTITESDDPQVAQTIKAHVASMVQRLNEGRVFNLFSPTLPVLFENKDKIKTQVEATDKGAVVTQTSSDAAVVAALQAHAIEVSDLARDGPVAMMRAAQAAMGMMARGPRFGAGAGSTPPARAAAAEPSR
jgi:hypothetical protein